MLCDTSHLVVPPQPRLSSIRSRPYGADLAEDLVALSIKAWAISTVSRWSSYSCSIGQRDSRNSLYSKIAARNCFALEEAHVPRANALDELHSGAPSRLLQTQFTPRCPAVAASKARLMLPSHSCSNSIHPRRCACQTS